MVALLAKSVVDGNLAPPFCLLCACLLDRGNHRCESGAAWDPSESFANQLLALLEAVPGQAHGGLSVAGLTLMAVVCLSVSFVTQLGTKQGIGYFEAEKGLV